MTRTRDPLGHIAIVCATTAGILLLFSKLAFAVDAPPPAFDAPAWVQEVYAAVTSKNWGLVAGLALIGLVYPLRLYGPAVFKTKLGGLALAFGVSLCGTFGAALLAGARPDIAMIVTALTTAATAAGVWEWIKAHLPGARAVADKATAPAPPELPKATARTIV